MIYPTIDHRLSANYDRLDSYYVRSQIGVYISYILII